MRARRTAGSLAVGLILAGGVAGPTAVARPTARSSASLPPPRFGHSLDVGLVSGTVIIKPPGKRAFTLGPQDRNIPIGSRIDTTHGRIDLRAAPPPPPPPPSPGAGAAATRVEDAQFYDGAFRVRQSPSLPMTQIRLAGGDFSACSAPSGDRPSAASAYPVPGRLSHAVLRLLHASGPGKFETVGRYAAATVRGTVWLTVDYCDGTLVRVRRGVVSVEDLVTHMTVVVHAGHSFFAAS